MSIKGQTFLKHLDKPQVASNFRVFITHIPKAIFRCVSASLPFPTRGECTISVSGQPVVVPGKEQVPGDWSCNLYESESSDMMLFLDYVRGYEVPSASNTDSPIRYHLGDVFIFLVDSENKPTSARRLGGAWIKSISPVSLDYSNPDTPVVYSVTFRYQTCESIL